METSDSQRDELNLIFKEENLGLDIEDIEDMVLHQEDLNNLGVKGEFEKSSEPSVGEPLSKKRKSNPSSTLIGEGVLQSLRLNSIEKEVILIKIKQNRLSNQLNKTQSLLEVLLKQVNKNQELLEIVISNQTTNQCSGSSGPIISSVEGQFENTGAAEDSGPISDDDDVIDSDVIGIDATDSDVIDIDVIIGATPEPDLPVSRPSSSLDTRVQTVLKDGSRSPRRTKPSKRSCTARGKIEYTSPLASKPASTSVTKDASSRVASGPASTSVMKDASSRVASGPASTTVKKDSSSALASKPASSSTVAKGNRFSIEPGISPLRDTRTYEDAEGLSKEALEENDEPVAHTSKDSFPAKEQNTERGISAACSNSSPCNWHVNYELPKFPDIIEGLLLEKLKLSVSQKDEIVTLLYEDTSFRSNFYPKSEQYDKVIDTLLSTYPALNCGSPIDISRTFWKRKLKSKFRNRRSIDGNTNPYVLARKYKPKTDVLETGSPEMQNKKARLTKGMALWEVPNYLPEYDKGEDESTQQKYSTLMKNMYNTKKFDPKKIDFYMTETFPKRRNLIVLQKAKVLEIVSEYPWLKEPKEISNEFRRVSGSTFSQDDLLSDLFLDKVALQDVWSRRKRPLTPAMADLVEKIAFCRFNADQEELEGELAVRWIFALLRENVESVICTEPEIKEINAPSNPVFLHKKKEDDWSLHVEELTVSGIKSFSMALFLLVSSYYVFNLGHEERSLSSLLFIQRKYFKFEEIKLDDKSISLVLKINDYQR